MLSIVYRPLPTVSCLPWTVYHSLSITHCQPSSNCLVSFLYHPLSLTAYHPYTVYRLPSTNHYLLSAIYRLVYHFSSTIQLLHKELIHHHSRASRDADQRCTKVTKVSSTCWVAMCINYMKWNWSGDNNVHQEFSVTKWGHSMQYDIVVFISNHIHSVPNLSKQAVLKKSE